VSSRKDAQASITLLACLGVKGDAHAGSRVQHLYSKRKYPAQPNLRQVHLIASELLDELAESGFAILT
jgi:hypothetical protein